MYRKKLPASLVAIGALILSALTGEASLVSHYTFDDAGQIGNDSGTFDNDGTAAGSAQFSSDAQVGGGSMLLDGNADYLNIGGAAELSALDDNGDGFTLTTWIKPGSLSGVRRIVSVGMFSGFSADGWGAGISGAATFATTYGRADFNSDVDSLTSGVWSHVAYVYRPSAGEILFYVDGDLVATQTGTAGMNNTTTGFVIGGIALPGNGQWFDGRIDDLRIYDDELGAAEIEALASPGATPIINHFFVNPAPLVAAGSVALSWSVQDADTVSIDGGSFSDQDVTGMTSISSGLISTTTTYTLTATASGGSTSQQVTIAVTGSAQDPIISEFVASNIGGLTDEDGATSDWIEIFNPNAFDVGLGGWHLTDDTADLAKWEFPEVSIPGGGYLIVFASNNDRAIAGAELHTDFKLSAGGEYLALTRPDDSIADEFTPTYPAQSADYSYGDSGGTGAFFDPTPGAVNGAPLEDLPPIILSVTEDPPQPKSTSALPVTAEVQGLGSPVAAVTLRYRINFGAETSLSMAATGGNLYSATIPASAYSAGDMVRWYVLATSSGGSSRRAPLFDDPVESAEFFGTVVSDTGVTTPLPILNWFVQNESGSETRTGAQASLFFEGKFYDNVYCRIRGQSAGSWPKHKFKFDFYKGGHFKWDVDQPKVEEFNLQSFYREMFTQSSNTSYMREPMMFDYMRSAGAEAPDSKYMHVRRNGDFYGLYAFIEQVDEDFLIKHGYSANGALYKAAWQGGGPATLSPNPQAGQYRKGLQESEPFTDLADFCANINVSNPDRFEYVWDHVDVAQWINVIAAMNVPFNHDQLTKNYYVYFEPDSGEWHRFPWDADQSFPIGQYITGENWTNPRYGDTQHTQELSGGNPNPSWQNHMHDAIMDNPVTREMYMRRVKNLADRYLAETGVSVTLIPETASASYLVPTDSALDATWAGSSFDDSGWSLGQQGFGYENTPGGYDSLINTRIKPPEAGGGANTIFLRYEFFLDAAQLAEIQSLTLRMKFDDAFIAYLNGAEIARDNIVGAATWNTTTGGRGSDSLNDNFAEFSVSGLVGSLVVGENVLAIHAINSSTGNSDMLLIAELLGGSLSYFEGKIEATRALISADADADRIEWAGKGVGLSDIDSGISELLNVALPSRRSHLFDTYAHDGSNPQLPNSAPANPTLAFGAIEYNPASGNQDEEYIEIRNEEGYAVDISDWTLEGGVSHMFQAGTVLPSNGSLFLSPDLLSFRARSVSPMAGESRFAQGNYSGHLSNLGEVLTLRDSGGGVVVTTTTPSDPSDAQLYMVVSEILYHPADPNPDGEFIELLNTSASVTLDLEGVAFTAGIDYVFPAGTELAPGARVVISFSDFLDASRLGNGGDRIKVEDADGSTIREFTYDDAAPWPTTADGSGASLVLIDPELVPDHGVATNWRPSMTFGGNPGGDDRIAFAGGDLLDHALAGGERLSVGEGGVFEFEYSIRIGADDTRVIVQTSTDLSVWSEAGTTLLSSVHDGAGAVTHTIALAHVAGFDRLYVRLLVELR